MPDHRHPVRPLRRRRDRRAARPGDRRAREARGTAPPVLQHDDYSDSAWISFNTVADMTVLVSAVCPDGVNEEDELQARVSDWEVYDPESNRSRLGWRWNVAPEHLEGSGWDFAGRVEFPVSDPPTVTERLAQAASSAASRTASSTQHDMFAPDGRSGAGGRRRATPGRSSDRDHRDAPRPLGARRSRGGPRNRRRHYRRRSPLHRGVLRAARG